MRLTSKVELHYYYIFFPKYCTSILNLNKYFTIQINIRFLFLVDDASGHYTSGFFYGNNYWLGSLSLCESIYHEDDHDSSNSKSVKNSGLPFAKAHSQIYTTVYNENPPFIPGFFVIKLFLNDTFPALMVITHILINSYQK